MATADEHVTEDKLTTAAEGVKDDRPTTAAGHAQNIRLTTADECIQFLRRINQEHETAVIELQMLESYINDLVRKAANSRRMGRIGQTISNLIHHSVAESVHDVYEHYVFFKRFQSVWIVNKLAIDLNSDQAFRRGISEINAQLVQNVHSMINENQKDVYSDRKAATMLAMYSYHSRPS